MDFCACESAVRAKVKLLSNQLMVFTGSQFMSSYNTWAGFIIITCITRDCSNFSAAAFLLVLEGRMAMSAKDQMSKLLDQLMGQNRDGE